MNENLNFIVEPVAEAMVSQTWFHISKCIHMYIAINYC